MQLLACLQAELDQEKSGMFCDPPLGETVILLGLIPWR